MAPRAPSDIPTLLWRLRGSRPAEQAQALLLLADLAEADPRQCSAFVASGGIPVVIGLLRSSSTRVQGLAALALSFVALSSRECSHAVARAGAVAPLAAQLGGGMPGPWQAAQALCNLSMHQPFIWQLEELERSISGLVPFLRSGQDPQTQWAAAGAIAHLARTEPGADLIVAAGGLPLLIALLSQTATNLHPTDTTAARAASALNVLSSVSKRHRQAAAAAGAAAPLLALLSSTTGQPSAPYTTLALRNLLIDSRHAAETVAAGGGIQLLVRQLRDSQDEAARWASANALHFLAEWSPEHSQAIAAEGAIPLLEHMLHSTDSGAHAKIVAADALRMVSAGLLCLPAEQRPPPPRVCSARDCVNGGELRRCGACRAVRYCSEACNRASWPSHRPSCRRLRPAATKSQPASCGKPDAPSDSCALQ